MPPRWHRPSGCRPLLDRPHGVRAHPVLTLRNPYAAAVAKVTRDAAPGTRFGTRRLQNPAPFHVIAHIRSPHAHSAMARPRSPDENAAPNAATAQIWPNGCAANSRVGLRPPASACACCHSPIRASRTGRGDRPAPRGIAGQPCNPDGPGRGRPGPAHAPAAAPHRCGARGDPGRALMRGAGRPGRPGAAQNRERRSSTLAFTSISTVRPSAFSFCACRRAGPSSAAVFTRSPTAPMPSAILA